MEQEIEAPDQDIPEQDQPDPSVGPESESASDQPSSDGEEEARFTDAFDPDELPDELRPRYQQMQADYTRKTMELARMRKEAEQALAVYDAILDPDRAPGILSALGYEIDPEDEVDAYGEEGPPIYDPALDEVRAELDELRTQFATQAENDYMVGELAAIENKIGRELSPEELNLMTQMAMSNRMPDGTPDVQSAWATLQKITAAEQQRWVSSKRQAPRIQRQGASEVDERIDRSDPEVRRKLMEEAISRELESSS